MSEYKLRAGAGKAEIIFPAEMFPTDNLVGVHDTPAVRILVLDSGVRVAIVSAEMVNLGEDDKQKTLRSKNPFCYPLSRAYCARKPYGRR